MRERVHDGGWEMGRGRNQLTPNAPAAAISRAYAIMWNQVPSLSLLACMHNMPTPSSPLWYVG